MIVSLIFEFIIIHYFKNDFTYYRVQYTIPLIIFVFAYLILNISIMINYCRKPYGDKIEKTVRSFFDIFLIVGILIILYWLIFVMINQAECILKLIS